MWGREPALIATAIRAVILAATAFGLGWTAEQIAAVMLAVETVLAVAVRETVTSPHTLHERANAVFRDIGIPLADPEDLS